MKTKNKIIKNNIILTALIGVLGAMMILAWSGQAWVWIFGQADWKLESSWIFMYGFTFIGGGFGICVVKIITTAIRYKKDKSVDNLRELLSYCGAVYFLTFALSFFHYLIKFM